MPRLPKTGKVELRSGHEVELPEGKYETEWGKCVKTLDVPIEQSDGPTEFVLAYKPTNDVKQHIVNVSATFLSEDVASIFSEFPFRRQVRPGIWCRVFAGA